MDEDELIQSVQHVTYEAASEVLTAGLARAVELGVKVGIVVTDRSGDVVAAARATGAGAQACRGAEMKAADAARLGVPIDVFIEKRLKQDEILWRAMSAHPETFLVPGGCPLVYGETPVGGVGVSGGKYSDDAEVARAAAGRLSELAGAAS